MSNWFDEDAERTDEDLDLFENLLYGDEVDDRAVEPDYGSEDDDAPLGEDGEPLEDEKRIYAGLAYERYDLMSDAVNGAIADMHLDDAYQLPDKESFYRDIEILSPFYDVMLARGWEPEFVFVPDGLTHQQWSGLLGTSDGGQPRDVLDASGLQTFDDELFDFGHGESPWRLVVICTTVDVPIAGISPDGERGQAAGTIMRTLEDVVSVDEFDTAEEVVKYISPTAAEYLAAQWTRLIDREEPLDSDGTATLLQDCLLYTSDAADE